jgi:arsenate reductase
MARSTEMNVRLVASRGDAGHDALMGRVDDKLHELGQVATLTRHDVEDASGGELWRHLGAPSVFIDGVDLEGRRPMAGAPARRTYAGEPEPPDWLIEAGIVRACRPSHVLFMCEANSARSQIAEGLARWLAPPGVEIWSAGSQPAALDPMAAQVLEEIGLDASHHFAKGVDRVPLERIEALVTLCAGETCPTVPGLRLRAHWVLPDPAAVVHDEPSRLRAFRGTREILSRRLETLFRCWNGCGT